MARNPTVTTLNSGGRSYAVASYPASTISYAHRPFTSAHLPVLDGIRGLAILMVLLLHFMGDAPAQSWFGHAVARVSSYGCYGVDLFFVLSGFLITGVLYDTRNDRRYFRNFYARRALRIFPLYYAVLFLVFIVAPLITALRGPELDFLVDRQNWAWIYAVNWYIARQGDWDFGYLNHLWSLSIEEQFYLLWPPLVLLVARSPRLLLRVSLALALGSGLLRLAGSLAGFSWWTIYTATPSRLDGLAIGAFLAIALRQPGGPERLRRALPLIAAVLGIALPATFFLSRFSAGEAVEPLLQLRVTTITMLLACLLLWTVFAPERSATARLFRSRTMVFFGTYSYGLYIFHHFISYYFESHHTSATLGRAIGSEWGALALQTALGVSVSVLLAYLSYELFEKRFLQLKAVFCNSPQKHERGLARAGAEPDPRR